MGCSRNISIVLIYTTGLCALEVEAAGGAAAQSKAVASAAPAKPGPSLRCEGGTFSRFLLKNTRERTYRSSDGNTCSLSKKAEGVIWIARGEGLALKDAEKKLSFTDDRGSALSQTCWTRSGGINGIDFTELILVGSADSKKIKVCCGETCADAVVE